MCWLVLLFPHITAPPGGNFTVTCFPPTSGWPASGFYGLLKTGWPDTGCGSHGPAAPFQVLVAAVNLQRQPVRGFCAEADRVHLDMAYTAGFSADFGAECTDGVRCTAERQ